MAGKSTRSVEIQPVTGDSASVPSCFSPMPFPTTLRFYAIATLEHGKVVVCGGIEDDGL